LLAISSVYPDPDWVLYQCGELDYGMRELGVLRCFYQWLGFKFFHSYSGLRQGCPLPPYLFLHVAEGLSQYIPEAKCIQRLQGVKVGTDFHLTHLLFVDDVLIFLNGSLIEDRALHELLVLFSTDTRMEVSEGKSLIYMHGVVEQVEINLINLFMFQKIEFDEGFKYPGFQLKPNFYGKKDESWLIENFEKRNHMWCDR
jgi:hypothetical protein